jgi:putative transposase
MSAMVWDLKQFLSSTSDNELDAIRKHERTGRPLGGDNFLSLLEEKISRKKRSQALKRTTIR